MSNTTREVAVLADFKDPTGIQRQRGEVFTVAYETEPQRKKVNELMYRGFITLDLEAAKAFQVIAPVPPQRKSRRKPS